MAIYLTIDGEQYPMLVGSLSASLQSGLAGTTLSAQVCSIGASPPNPNTNLPVELTIGSLTFNCRLASVSHESRSGASVVVYSLQANGPQERLRRNVAYSSRITTAVSSILDDLLLGSGLTGSVPDDKNLTGGFDFSGTLGDAIAKLAGRAGMGIYIGPSGVVNLRDLTNLDAAPFAWTVGSKNPFSNFTKSRSKDLPITRVYVKGAVEKEDPADPDSDTRTLRFTMNGVDAWVDIPRDVLYDEITDVRLNSTSQTITFRGSGSEAAAQVVHYQKGRRLFFNTLPANADVAEVDITIQYAYGMAEDTAVQAELSAIPPSGWDGIVEHTITDQSIRTSAQAQQLADEQIVVLSQPKKTMAATVHSASIFEPLELVTGTHSVDGWSEQLPVASNQLSWDNAKGEIKQEVSCENGSAPTSGGTSGSAGGLRSLIRTSTTANASSPPPVPTQSSSAGPPLPLFGSVASIAFDTSGNCYIADDGNYRVRKVTALGMLSTIAGTGDFDDTGDGGPAIDAATSPVSLRADSIGNLFIGSGLYRIRKIDTDGVISTFAGNGTAGDPPTGDGGPATSATIYLPLDLAINSLDEVFYCAANVNPIRYIDNSNVIDTLLDGLGNPIENTQYMNFDQAGGDLYFTDGNTIYKLSGGVISTVAGTGINGYTGDGGAATAANISSYHLCLDDDGNMYFCQLNEHVIRKVDTSGIITTFAGTGTAGYSGNGGPAEDAELEFPLAITFCNDALYFSDQTQSCIRKIDLTTGNISLFAGTPGQYGFGGDGGPAHL